MQGNAGTSFALRARVGAGVCMLTTVRRHAGQRNGGVGQRGGSGRRRKSPVFSGIAGSVSLTV
jgi:hypothetical protein